MKLTPLRVALLIIAPVAIGVGLIILKRQRDEKKKQVSV